jgi:uncharacterized coiled-coil protein SlyX
MRKLILLAILIAGSFNSFSQTATTNNPVTSDSIVCIPKHIVIKVIQDLEKGDMNEKQVEILNENLIIKDNYIAKQDSVIKTQTEKVKSFESSVMAQNDVNDVNLKTIENLNLTIKKQNKKIKGWKIIVVALLVGIAIK